MRHRADDNKIPWMDKLAEDEIKGINKKASVQDEFVAEVLGDRNPFGGSIIDKIAADDAAADSSAAMDDIEKKIDSATSVEELDALEEQLKKLNLGDDAAPADGTAPADDASAAPTAPAGDLGSSPAAAPGSSPSPDLASLKQDIGKIKETMDDKAQDTNNQLLLEIKKLNEAMGTDKVVDLNNSIS